MAKGMQPAGPEWRRLCKQLRKDLLALCPLDNRRWVSQPGTFRRIQVAEQSGVNLHLLRRFMDMELPVTADTAIALGEWMGLELRWVRVKPLPKPIGGSNGSTTAANAARAKASPKTRKKSS